MLDLLNSSQSAQFTRTDCREIVRETLLGRQLSPRSVDIMLASLTDSTYKQYDGCIRSWIKYCEINNICYHSASISEIIHYLSQLFDQGVRYGTINSHKAAISLLMGNPIDDNRIKRFMKGVYRLRPPTPKYDIVWEPNIVLNYLSQFWPNHTLSLEDLSKKTVTLIALVTAHRVQTISLIKISNVVINQGSEVIIKIPDFIKTSGLNINQPVLKLPFFTPRPEICPALSIIAYLNKTAPLRVNNQERLFLSYKKPHQEVSSQTISHWIKFILGKSGVDISIFSAHSTRHASTSSANRIGVSIEVIKKTAGWSEQSGVFAKFYNKEIINDQNSFARSILTNNNNNCD
ncbi:uncharacterized protein LOC123868426 isoform X1 [Maniola jurtina]|uniref:uncharacterized protein LOC123868426 isoform X1 n=2 Tax=Maniola jurtina TaxID=191418 RepID=UPI001E689ACD|nr:uncharacterized protein LOC123868426 isoform X1 [Maniola jurtina]